jgi:parvulin-like peptidyl-prolyl isomerase
MKRFFVVLMMTIFLAGNVFSALEISDKTVAVVNGEPIFKSYFNSVFLSTAEEYKHSLPASEQNEQKMSTFKDLVLSQEIDRVILKQEAKKQKIRTSKKELQDAINKIKKNFENEFEFNAELKKENITNSEFEKRLAEQLTIIKLIRESIESKIKRPTEIEVKALYNTIIKQMKDEKTTDLVSEENMFISNLTNVIRRIYGEQIKLRQIFIECPKGATSEQVKKIQIKIYEVKKELQKHPFNEVASKYSEDQTSKTKNGDLGLIAKIDLPYSISKIVFNMKIGEYTKEPIKTDIGYHFIKVEERRTKREITFDDVENDLAESLYQNNVKKTYINYVDELKSKANIKINKNW